MAAKTYLEITDRNLRTNGPHGMLRTTRKRYPEILCKYYSGCVKAQNKKAKKAKTNCDLRGFPTGTRHGQLKLQASDETAETRSDATPNAQRVFVTARRHEERQAGRRGRGRRGRPRR